MLVNLLILFLLPVNLCYSADKGVLIKGLVSVKYLGGVYHPDAEAKLSKGQNLIKGLKDVEFYYVDKGSVCKNFNKFFKDGEYGISCISVEERGASITYRENMENVKFDSSLAYTIEVFRASRCNVELILDDDPAKKHIIVNDVKFETDHFSTDSVLDNTTELFANILAADINSENHIGINLRDYKITEFSCSDGSVDCKDPKFWCYLDQTNKGDKYATLGLLFNDVFNPSNKLLLLKLKKKLTKDVPKVGGGLVKSRDVDKKPSDRKSLNKCCRRC